MKILAIETSCDDTGIAILEISGGKKSPSFNALSNIVSSQIKVHKKYGGVYPMMAKREHQKNLIPTLENSLKQAGMLIQKSKIKNQNNNSKFKNIGNILEREPELLKKIIPFLKKYGKPDVDVIAVTNGPGLEPCLWVGINFTKVLSYFWNIPIVPVNHIESHILINFLDNKGLKFPAIALVVSGGHTQLILMKSIGRYEILGETRDDAAGECFDKTARILGLGYPGGPIIAKQAEGAKNKFKIKLPRPMINTKDYDFSFSGLKTAVLYENLKKSKKIRKNKEYTKEMCKEIQQSVIDVLIKKTIKASMDHKVKTIILGGGVTANNELRKQLKLKIENCELKINLLVPPKYLCTDNGLMVALAGYFRVKNNKFKKWQDIEVNANLRIQ